MPAISAPIATSAPGEILHVRLAGRVAQHGSAFGQHRRHERVLGAGDARLIQEDVFSLELLGLELVTIAHHDRSAEVLQRQKMGVHPAAADHVAAGRRQGDLAESRQQRTGQQDRSADLGAERRVECLRLDASCVHPNRIGASPVGAPRRDRPAARASFRRRECGGYCRGRPDRRPARWRRGSAGRRSCCRRDGRFPSAGDRRGPENVEAWPKLTAR